MANPNRESSRPAGYAALVHAYDLAVIPNWHESAVAAGNTHRVETVDGIVRELYPARYWRGDSLGDQLEFALKHDGVNLEILARLFAVAPRKDVVAYISSTPTGKYARRLWHLYELLAGERLPIDDLRTGNYVDLLDPQNYYTAAGTPVPRQRVRDNLLGDARFCPMVRKTPTLEAMERAELAERCRQVMAQYPEHLLKRALSYLYTKETRSSFEIERIVPDTTRTDRFVAMLQLAEQEDFLRKDALITLQNLTVDARFRDQDYRRHQNYVGETVALGQERVHFVPPKPEDLSSMLEGLYHVHARMDSAGIHPIVHAAVASFAFVFLHPFEDGNGRVHRFLIHNVLARRGFTPKGIMFPVSAAMLRERAAYDAALEAFSRPLMRVLEYSLEEDGRLAVLNDTAACYRYLDMTPQVEALFGFVERTVETDLVQELAFLRNYDRAKHAMQEIVDMPDRLLDTCIRLCLQNRGRVSNRKRTTLLAKLTDDEITRLEAAVQEAYGVAPGPEARND